MPAIIRLVTACILLMATPVSASTLPRLPATDLNDNQVILPDPHRAAIYIVTFSREAGELAEPWAQALHNSPVLFSVSVLEGIPGIVRRIIRRAMRKQFDGEDLSYVVTTDRNREQWRAFGGNTDISLPTIVCFDPNTSEISTLQGAYSATLLDRLPCKPKLKGEYR